MFSLLEKQIKEEKGLRLKKIDKEKILQRKGQLDAV